MSCRVKICGVTSVEDADLVLQCGADMIGVNLIVSSKRHVDVRAARAIVEHVRGKLSTALVVANPSLEQARQMQAAVGADYLQLHGNETPALLEQLGERAFKAVRIADADDVVSAGGYPGPLLLADAKVPGHLGGSGVTFDWNLVRQLAQQRPLLLAGGLNADNVARAVSIVKPWGVDVASGVEFANDPRHKDPQRTAQFLTAVRQAVI